MHDGRNESKQGLDWNVLTSPWLDVQDLNANDNVYSPLGALNRASEIRCIVSASPLDLFAAHRFLLTLLYWKARAAGGVQQVRESLLNGRVPPTLFDALKAEESQFRLFDDKAPFLQEATQKSAKKTEWKSVGSLFAEFASGTNIAHFHHGDDQDMRLCLRCITIGMMRIVPWTQSGGAGLSPAVHNAPPIMAMASGANLAVTLGLNLIPLDVKPGRAKWTGHFVPTAKDAPIPYLEALTWNPRRIHLLSPELVGRCWGCGRHGVTVLGPIVYRKNEETQMRKGKGQKTIPFTWQDPSAFYGEDNPYTTVKSVNEAMSATGRDLTRLLEQDGMLPSAVVTKNPNHEGWCLVIPSTNPANNKTFDHRYLELSRLSADVVRSAVGADVSAKGSRGLSGWVEPRRPPCLEGATRFVQAAGRFLGHGDWAILSAAAYREMHDSPGAFDIFSGLFWSLRGKVGSLPSRNAAWLVLKLMAAVPSGARGFRADAAFRPLCCLPRRQIHEHREGRSCTSPYPVSLARGRRLEAELRDAIEKNMRKRCPEPIDWAGLCHALDQLLD